MITALGRDMRGPRQLCTFMVDGLLFGVDVMNVQEVLGHQKTTPVPLAAAAAVRGLVNLRGQIVTAIEMRVRLGLPQRRMEDLPMNVVTTTRYGTLSLLVDELGDVIEVDEQAFEAPPDMMNAALREMVCGVYKLEGRLLLLLDAERVAALGQTSVSQNKEATKWEL